MWEVKMEGKEICAWSNVLLRSKISLLPSIEHSYIKESKKKKKIPKSKQKLKAGVYNSMQFM